VIKPLDNVIATPPLSGRAALGGSLALCYAARGGASPCRRTGGGTFVGLLVKARFGDLGELTIGGLLLPQVRLELADDILAACETLDRKGGGVHESERAQVKTNVGF